RLYDITNTTQNPQAATNQIPVANTNLTPATNQLTPTGIPAFEQANFNVGSTQTVNFSITNTLGRMSRAQATNVIQVQSSLTVLQNIAVTIGRVQNIQPVIQTPQMQQQIQQVSGQILALAQGPV